MFLFCLEKVDLLLEIGGLRHGDEPSFGCFDLSWIKLEILESFAFLRSPKETDDVGKTSRDFFVTIPHQPDTGVFRADETESSRLLLLWNYQDSRFRVCLGFESRLLDFLVFFDLQVDRSLGPLGRWLEEERRTFPPEF